MNINDTVRFKLTEEGIDLWCRSGEPLPFVRDGRHESQLWVLMSALGSGMRFGSPNLIVGNEIEPVEPKMWRGVLRRTE